MSRSCYSDDYGDDFPGQLELYRANVARSIRSRKGQDRLRELRDALLAMPTKSLEAETFLKPSGEACALGVWADRYTKDGPEEDRAVMQAFQGDDHETADLLEPLGWPKLVVLDLIYQNDDCRMVYTEVLGPHQSPYAYFSVSPWQGWPVRYGREETGEERHARVLTWINDHIADATTPPQPGARP